MKHNYRWMVVILMMTALVFAACRQQAGETEAEPHPALVEAIEGTEFNRVTLTERAAQRLGIETTPIREELVAVSYTHLDVYKRQQHLHLARITGLLLGVGDLRRQSRAGLHHVEIGPVA